jgi:hypothetical protein
MLYRTEARAFGEHPAGEDFLARIVGFDLLDLDKGCRLRLFGDIPRVAGIGFDIESAETLLLTDFGLEGRGEPGDLVEAGKDGDRIGDAAGFGRLSKGQKDHDQEGTVHDFDASTRSLT